MIAGIVLGFFIASYLATALYFWGGYRLDEEASKGPASDRSGSLVISLFFSTLALFFAGILLGTYYARLAYELVSFRGGVAIPSLLEFSVIGFETDRYQLLPRVNVRLNPKAREITLKVDRELENSVEPYRQPGLDCLLLTVETATNGTRRVVVPNFFDSGIRRDRLEVCSGYKSPSQ